MINQCQQTETEPIWKRQKMVTLTISIGLNFYIHLIGMKIILGQERIENFLITNGGPIELGSTTEKQSGSNSFYLVP
jgi:hypothetical protein